MRRHRWAVILGGGMLTAGAIIAAYVVRSRRNPSACPYSQSIVLEFPRPFFTRDRLRQLLDPRPGERVLEVGPGRGYYALDVAPRLFPGGTLDVVDLQQGMLDVELVTVERRRTRSRFRQDRGTWSCARRSRRFPASRGR